MSLPAPVVAQLRKLIQDNVNKFFGPLRPTEKTPDKVRAFAQNQLNFFINGIVRESAELRTKWAKGHPYHAHLRMTGDAKVFEVEISCDE